MPVSHQEIAASPHALPEHVRQDVVVREDQSRHGEHEQADQREEPGVSFVAVHVADREHGDQARDEGHHREHHRAQSIDAELDRDLEIGGRQPAHHLPFLVMIGRIKGAEREQERQGDPRDDRDVSLGFPSTRTDDGQQRAEQREDGDQPGVSHEKTGDFRATHCAALFPLSVQFSVFSCLWNQPFQRITEH